MAKNQPKAVRIEVLRPYPRGGRTFKPGTKIVVPEYAVKSITEASPPFGKVVEKLGAPPAATSDTAVEKDAEKDSKS